MTFPDRLEQAFARLTAAVHHLEAAAERRAETDASRGDVDQEFLMLQDDRSRLAGELDAALARNHALLAAQADVAARLERAGATVEEVVARIGAVPIEATPEPVGEVGAAQASPEPDRPAD